MPELTSSAIDSGLLLPVTAPGPAVPAVGGWHGCGLCIGENPDVFFPSHGDPGTKARQICAACAVRAQCLDYAIKADEFGIWGGLDQQARRNLGRKRRCRQKANQPMEASSAGTTGAA